MTIYICDTETAASGNSAEICEISFLRVSPLVDSLTSTARLSQLSLSQTTQRYKPSHPIAPFVSNIHGIYDRDVKHCPSVDTLRIPEDATMLICHNVPFDRAVLTHHYRRIEEPMPDVRWLCTLKLAKLMEKIKGESHVGGNKLLSLFALYHPAYFAQFKTKAHGAEADCQMTLLVLHSLVAEWCEMVRKVQGEEHVPVTLQDVAEFLDTL